MKTTKLHMNSSTLVLNDAQVEELASLLNLDEFFGDREEIECMQQNNAFQYALLEEIWRLVEKVRDK